jgi:predicted naringenin-chalcone synthase
MTLRPAILAIGLATPAPTPQHELADLTIRITRAGADGADRIRRLYAAVGIEQRGAVLTRDDAIARFESASHERGPSTAERLAVYEHHAPILAREAAAQALRAARLGAERINHLITVSCTGFGAPGVDRALIGALGLSTGVERTHVGFMGCHGMLNALRIARALASSDPESRVLVVAVEICSAHVSYEPSDEKRLVSALFADGAGAAVVGSAPGAMPLTSTAARVLPDSEDDMTWRIGDHGFEMTLSRRVPGLIREHLRPWIESWLDQRELEVEDISHWAIHPGGPKILDAAVGALRLPPGAADDSREVLRTRGNMSSPTILFILDKLRNAKRPIVALAFGPGLSIEAALIQ